MSLIRWNPRGLERSDQCDPFFDRFFDFFNQGLPESDGGWHPALDLVEEKDRLVVKVELPGVDPKSVDVKLQGDTLTIRGERKSEHEEQSGTYLRREQAVGTFQRTVQLPYRVESGQVKATYSDGIMTISMPKAEEFVGRQIPVEAK